MDRTVSFRLPALRPLTADKTAALTALLREQTDVIARLCADALAAAGRPSHGGLLRPEEALRLRPVEVLGPGGAEEPPTWAEQGRHWLVGVLEREAGLVRLIGVRSEEAMYWVYTSEGLERYVGGCV